MNLLEMGPAEVVLIGAPLFAAVVFPACRIAYRLGLPWGLGFLAVVPVANLVLLWVLAFAGPGGRVSLVRAPEANGGR